MKKIKCGFKGCKFTYMAPKRKFTGWFKPSKGEKSYMIHYMACHSYKQFFGVEFFESKNK